MNITIGISSTSAMKPGGIRKNSGLSRALPVWLVPLTLPGPRSACDSGWPPFSTFGKIAVGKNESTRHRRSWPRLNSTVKAIGPTSAPFFGWMKRSTLTSSGYEKFSVQSRRLLAGYG